MSKFLNGDRVICNCKLKKRIDVKWVWFTKTRCRIIRLNDKVVLNYRVYNIDLKKYDIIGEVYLKKDVEYYRDTKIEKILN